MNMQEFGSRHFEQLVVELFDKLGFVNIRTNVAVRNGAQHRLEIDIIFGELPDTVGVEVKHYRYASPPRIEMLQRALHKAQMIKRAGQVKRCMLVVSCPLTPSLAAAVSEYSDVEVWDAHLLLSQALCFPDLFRKFELALEVNASDILQVSADRIAGDVVERGDIAAADGLVEDSKGRTLFDALKAVEPGRAMAGEFEDKCIAALKYIFEGDLFGWHEQNEADDGLHRRDLVCRILPNSEVWRLMLVDLKSRYVVFEFKNYSGLITQNEVVTTEKYLYPSALRNVAIIISPCGCSVSARKIIQGAMREHGKLIIPLTVDDLGALLVGKDGGSDPNTYLFERVDEFLMGLGR